MTFASYITLKTSEVPESIDSSIYSIIPISRNDGKKGKSGLCMVVDAFSPNALQAIFSSAAGQEWFADEIAKIRGRIASGLQTVTESDVSVSSVLKYLTTANESQRLSKESIAEWFDSSLAAIISAAVQEKNPGIASDKVTKLVEGYKKAFQSLSGRDVSMSDTLKQQLERAMLLLPEEHDSPVAIKLAEKLEAVTDAAEVLNAL